MMNGCALRVVGRAVLWLLCLALGGCLPSGRSQQDEERDPHFLAGKSCVSAMDFKGAIECFNQAVQANPKSASAHFELAWLFDQKDADPAAAIYHYESYLRLRPKADNAETVKTRIVACKQELARTIYLGPVNQSLQLEFERVMEENKRLREEIEKLKSASARATAATNLVSAPLAMPGRNTTSNALASAATPRSNASRSSNDAARPGTVRRTHTVQAGDTPGAIARKYGVKLEALMGANPGLDARRLKVGQVLSIPSY